MPGHRTQTEAAPKFILGQTNYLKPISMGSDVMKPMTGDTAPGDVSLPTENDHEGMRYTTNMSIKGSLLAAMTRISKKKTAIKPS